MRLVFFSIFFFTPFRPLEARKNKSPEFTVDLTGSQPYVHQWVEAEGKKKVSVMGQAYRPRPDLFVMELNAFPDGQTEIKSVKLKDVNGKIYEGHLRRLPREFMPTARSHFQNPETGENAAPDPSVIQGPKNPGAGS